MRDSVMTSAPGQTAVTRAELLARWTAARRRRDAAPLDSPENRAAVIEVGEIEVTINALDVTVSEGRTVRPAKR
jgi:DNA-binding response OmpR family regulator